MGKDSREVEDTNEEDLFHYKRTFEILLEDLMFDFKKVLDTKNFSSGQPMDLDANQEALIKASLEELTTGIDKILKTERLPCNNLADATIITYSILKIALAQPENLCSDKFETLSILLIDQASSYISKLMSEVMLKAKTEFPIFHSNQEIKIRLYVLFAFYQSVHSKNHEIIEIFIENMQFYLTDADLKMALILALKKLKPKFKINLDFSSNELANLSLIAASKENYLILNLALAQRNFLWHDKITILPELVIKNSPSYISKLLVNIAIAYRRAAAPHKEKIKTYIKNCFYQVVQTGNDSIAEIFIEKVQCCLTDSDLKVALILSLQKLSCNSHLKKIIEANGFTSDELLEVILTAAEQKNYFIFRLALAQPEVLWSKKIEILTFLVKIDATEYINLFFTEIVKNYLIFDLVQQKIIRHQIKLAFREALVSLKKDIVELFIKKTRAFLPKSDIKEVLITLIEMLGSNVEKIKNPNFPSIEFVENNSIFKEQRDSILAMVFDLSNLSWSDKIKTLPALVKTDATQCIDLLLTKVIEDRLTFSLEQQKKIRKYVKLFFRETIIACKRNIVELFLKKAQFFLSEEEIKKTFITVAEELGSEVEKIKNLNFYFSQLSLTSAEKQLLSILTVIFDLTNLSWTCKIGILPTLVRYHATDGINLLLTRVTESHLLLTLEQQKNIEHQIKLSFCEAIATLKKDIVEIFIEKARYFLSDRNINEVLTTLAEVLGFKVERIKNQSSPAELFEKQRYFILAMVFDLSNFSWSDKIDILPVLVKTDAADCVDLFLTKIIKIYPILDLDQQEKIHSYVKLFFREAIITSKKKIVENFLTARSILPGGYIKEVITTLTEELCSIEIKNHNHHSNELDLISIKEQLLSILTMVFDLSNLSWSDKIEILPVLVRTDATRCVDLLLTKVTTEFLILNQVQQEEIIQYIRTTFLHVVKIGKDHLAEIFLKKAQLHLLDTNLKEALILSLEWLEHPAAIKGILKKSNFSSADLAEIALSAAEQKNCLIFRLVLVQPDFLWSDKILIILALLMSGATSYIEMTLENITATGLMLSPEEQRKFLYIKSVYDETVMASKNDTLKNFLAKKESPLSKDGIIEAKSLSATNRRDGLLLALDDLKNHTIVNTFLKKNNKNNFFSSESLADLAFFAIEKKWFLILRIILAHPDFLCADKTKILSALIMNDAIFYIEMILIDAKKSFLMLDRQQKENAIQHIKSSFREVIFARKKNIVKIFLNNARPFLSDTDLKDEIEGALNKLIPNEDETLLSIIQLIWQVLPSKTTTNIIPKAASKKVEVSFSPREHLQERRKPASLTPQISLLFSRNDIKNGTTLRSTTSFNLSTQNGNRVGRDDRGSSLPDLRVLSSKPEPQPPKPSALATWFSKLKL